ncbi:uncharacterized protein N7469_006869 [Penicillium citrinum]|uniref:Uncharacterized protein n=1 Tax=Penicillium citrinum TaxID=5077 RepID=A0A9W9TL97_PENCI|nr:uncharacterized protein N7469_006869 [Penicillium citrinum]KAJ5226863.1 hypothetical protein N7469_006869 [Penicillium citrinum]
MEMIGRSEGQPGWKEEGDEGGCDRSEVKREIEMQRQLAALPIPADDEGCRSNQIWTSLKVALPVHVRPSLVEKS